MDIKVTAGDLSALQETSLRCNGLLKMSLINHIFLVSFDDIFPIHFMLFNLLCSFSFDCSINSFLGNMIL